MMTHDDFHYMSLALDDAGTPYVGTGAEGRVYTVDDAHVVTLVADTDERQVGALSVAGLPKNVARPGIGRVHRDERRRRLPSHPRQGRTGRRVDEQGARHGRARALRRALVPRDRRRSSFRRARATPRRPTRRGATWSNPIAAPGAITSPAARYVQVRARFARARRRAHEVHASRS